MGDGACPGESAAPLAEPTRTSIRRKLGFLRALHDSRWWFVFPMGIVLLTVGLIRLHNGPPTVQTRDGATLALVSEDLDSEMAVAAADPLLLQVKDVTSRPQRLAAVAPDLKSARPSEAPPPPTLGTATSAPSMTEIAAEVAHVGAIPRTGMCTYATTESRAAASTRKPPDTGFGAALADAAEAQLRDFVVYDDEYRTIKYPGGDVATLFGVCSDVVVRAYRALGIDLQKRVHEARVGSADTSIAHRRTQTLRRYFARAGASLPVTDYSEDYLPGDIITYDRPQNRGAQDHIAIVSNMRGPSGRFMIVHNRGYGPQMEDALFVDKITGHYRFDGDRGGKRTVISERASKIPARKKSAAAKRTAAAKMIKRVAKAKARSKTARTESPPKL
jgi:uncharacterized protein YijF (DUF1287 family)